jgi:hypothetical protein
MLYSAAETSSLAVVRAFEDPLRSLRVLLQREHARLRNCLLDFEVEEGEGEGKGASGSERKTILLQRDQHVAAICA